MYCGYPQPEPDKLTALILSGGQSSRMGSDKGLLTRNGETWVQYASSICSGLQLPVFFSINPSQIESYSSVIPMDNMIMDAEDMKGPLAGLMAFYTKYPQQDVLVLSCDMIAMKEAVIQTLINVYETAHLAHDIMVYQHADHSIEPFPGIYTSESLRKIYWLFISGDLKKYSMKHVIEISNSYTIPIAEAYTNCFLNANTPEDINRSK